MEVDKAKLIETLVSVCPRHSLSANGTHICKDIYLRQCHTYLGDRYDKCPPDCPHLEEAAADAHCKGDKCPKIKRLLKQLKQ